MRAIVGEPDDQHRAKEDQRRPVELTGGNVVELPVDDDDHDGAEDCQAGGVKKLLGEENSDMMMNGAKPAIGELKIRPIPLGVAAEVVIALRLSLERLRRQTFSRR